MAIRKAISSGLALAAVGSVLMAGCGDAREKLASQIDTASVVVRPPAVSSGASITQTVASTPTQAPQPTSTATHSAPFAANPWLALLPDVSNLRFAIVDGDGDISLARYDGSGQKKLVQRDQCPRPWELLWSPLGNRLACLSLDVVDSYSGSRYEVLAQYTAMIADTEGRVLSKINSVQSFAWSPTGRQVAYSVLAAKAPNVTYTYYVADADGNVIDQLSGIEGEFLWSPDGSAMAYNDSSGGVAIYDLNTKASKGLGSGIDRALGWVSGSKALLVASKYDSGDLAPVFEANLLDLTDGQRKRVAELDNNRSFWLSPDGSTAAFAARVASQPPNRLHLLDLATLAITTVTGSTISYPSDFIPYNRLTFSRDGSLIYWVDN